MWDLLLAFPPQHLLAFLAAGIVLNLTPGSDVIFATACGMSGGPRAGAVAALGVGLGGIWHVALAAAGISALIAAHPEALTAIKWGGAAYLVWLAWQSWNAGPASGAKAITQPWRAVRRGFLTNALNPKVALFILAFLPQFTDPALGPVWQQIVLLGGLFTLTGTLVTVGYGVLAGALGQALGTRMAILNKIAAVMLGGLAIRLIRG